MDIKILFLFLVLLLVVGTSTKENLSKDFMSQASGGILVEKDNSMPEDSFNKDPNSKTFESDLNSLIEKKEDDRAVVVNEDTTGLEVNKPAKVEQKMGKDLEEEGSGCDDTLIFGLVLLLVIYTVYFKIKN
jgi:hypothetical protein